tara:strand:+ start:228 stop:449 length:222 start_codon:yes stop_codon:yes gene_type:complete
LNITDNSSKGANLYSHQALNPSDENICQITPTWDDFFLNPIQYIPKITIGRNINIKTCELNNIEKINPVFLGD